VSQGERSLRGEARIALEGEVTIYNARANRDRVLKAARSASKITVDLSRVTEIDTAGVQLLLALKADCVRRGQGLSLVGHTAPVVGALDRYNLSGVFGDPMLLEPEADAR